MAIPEDALSFREIFGRHMRGRRGAMQAFYVAPLDANMPRSQQSEIVAGMRSSIIQALDSGEVFYLSSEITHMLNDASNSMQDRPTRLYHFEPQDFPALRGMVYIDGRLMLDNHPEERSPSQQRLVALAWDQIHNPSGEVAGKMLYSIVTNNYQDYDPGVPYSMRHGIPIFYGERFSPEFKSVDTYAIDMGWLPEETPEEAEARRQFEASVSEKVIRFAYTLFNFLQTEILVRESQDVPRSYAKVMGKEGRPVPTGIRVVKLRRFASSPPLTEGNEIPWSHRWIVRGHWRNQRVGPGRQQVRPTWVLPHIKGPEDKPLVVRETVQAVVR